MTRHTRSTVCGQGERCSGRTRWKDSSGSVVQTDLVNNGLYISQQWEKLCPGPVSRRSSRERKAHRRQHRRGGCRATASSLSVPARSLCMRFRRLQPRSRFQGQPVRQIDQGGERDGPLRQQDEPSADLGYVRNASVAINEAAIATHRRAGANVRGIAEIAGGQFDPKFTVTAGQAADARFEFGGDGTVAPSSSARWDIDLTIREVNESLPGLSTGSGRSTHCSSSVAVGNMTSAVPAGGSLATVPGGAALRLLRRRLLRRAGRARASGGQPA